MPKSQGHDFRVAQGRHKAKPRQTNPLHKVPAEATYISHCDAQGGAQGGAQGDAQGKMNTRQLGVHKADAQGAQGFSFLYNIVILIMIIIIIRIIVITII